MKTHHYLWLTIGLGWLTFAAWIVTSEVILRETRLGFFAERIDKLSNFVSSAIFFAFWAILLLGWIVPLVSGLKPVFRRNA